MWEKVIRKLDAGMMPPQGPARPDQATTDGLVTWLKTSLDRDAAAQSESRALAAAPPESRGVRERRSRPAGARARRGVAPAARRLELRVRQHRRHPRQLARAARKLRERGDRNQRDRGRQPRRRHGEQRDVHGAVRYDADRSRGRPAARHARRPAHPPHVPARRRVPLQDQAVAEQLELDPRPVAAARRRDHDRRRARVPEHHRHARRLHGAPHQPWRRRGAGSIRACRCGCR